MASITLEAPAKLNLYLHLTGKRDDGYHTLESLVAFTELSDTLVISENENLVLRVKGEFARDSGELSQNLVVRAARALRAKTGCKKGALLTLTKHIPAGGGLGGGSADAAAALRGLNRFWGLNLSNHDVQYIARSLGADVPMCLDNTPSIARGVGEVLAPVLPPPPKLHVLLVHPRVALLTKDVFALSRLGDPCPEWNPQSMHPRAFITALKQMHNHLQRPAIAVDSRVAEVLLTLEMLLPQPDLVRMTGSGACCFALYVDAEAARRARDNITNLHPEWWVKLTSLR